MRPGTKAMMIAVLLAGLAPAVWAGALTKEASPPPECDKCKTHGFFGAAVHHFGSGDTEYDCNLFNSCHGGDQIGYCAEYHFGCDEAMNFDRSTDFDTIDRALGAGELQELRGLMARSAAVKIVGGRNAIQVVDCNGAVIAHFPVSQPLGRALGE